MANGKNDAADFGLLILRLALAVIMIWHGAMKVFPLESLEKFAGFLGNLGLPSPYPLAVAATVAEIGGGLLVGLGILPRLGALGIAAVMLVAIFKVHLKNGFLLKTTADAPGPIPHGFEYNLALLAMALCILFAGGGKLSALAPKPKPKPAK
ncbi:MAG: DoxX family protein [Planctomycetota bacterium]